MTWRIGIGVMVFLSVILGGGYVIYWHVVVSELETAVGNWFADWERAGFNVGYDIAGSSGFPMLARLQLTNVVLADPRRAWRWAGETATLEIQPWKPTSYRLELAGTQKVDLPIAGRIVETESRARQAVALAKTDLNGRLRYASIDLQDLQVNAPALQQSATAKRLVLELELPEKPPSRHDETFGDLLLSADDLSLPAGYHGPLGDHLNRLSARLTLMGPLERRETEDMLVQWRDAGGVLELPWLRLDWGPLRLEGEGTLALDGFLRPEGAVTARIKGIDQTMNRFAEAGILDRTMARLVSAGLQLLAVRPDDGSEPYVATPLEAQDGALYIGPLKVAELPPLIPKRSDIDRAAPAPLAPVEGEIITEP